MIETLSAAVPLLDAMLQFVDRALCEDDSIFIEDMALACRPELIGRIYQTLLNAIDIEKSFEDKVLTIRRGYDSELDRLREIYDGLEDYLTEAAREILSQVPLLNCISVEYVPQIGYLVVIDMSDRNFVDSEVFEFIYELNGKGYFKNNIVLSMDDSIGDIKNMVLDKQRALLLSVEEYLLDAEEYLIHMSSIMGRLDATISLGVIAMERNFTRPDISEDSVIIIKNGRHPLQELAVDIFVPNDTYITADRNVALITGQNGIII